MFRERRLQFLPGQRASGCAKLESEPCDDEDAAPQRDRNQGFPQEGCQCRDHLVAREIVPESGLKSRSGGLFQIRYPHWAETAQYPEKNKKLKTCDEVFGRREATF